MKFLLPTFILLSLFSCTSNPEQEECDKIQVIDLADYEFFEPYWFMDSLDWVPFEDGQWTDNYLRMGNSIYRVESTVHPSDGFYTEDGEYISLAYEIEHDYCCIKLLHENIAESFMVSTLGGYAKTESHLYIYDQINVVGGESIECEKCDEYSGVVSFGSDSIIVEADPSSFHHINVGYCADQNHYFHNDSILTTANVSDSLYYADIPYLRNEFVCIGKNVYWCGEVLTDVNSFHFDEDDSRSYDPSFLEQIFGEETLPGPNYVLTDGSTKWIYESEYGHLEEIPFDAP
jgi:hypothetical protein